MIAGPKDLPIIARTAGRLAGRAIGYVQLARGQFENVMQQSQARQVLSLNAILLFSELETHPHPQIHELTFLLKLRKLYLTMRKIRGIVIVCCLS